MVAAASEDVVEAVEAGPSVRRQCHGGGAPLFSICYFTLALL